MYAKATPTDKIGQPTARRTYWLVCIKPQPYKDYVLVESYSDFDARRLAAIMLDCDPERLESVQFVTKLGSVFI
jgi:hypothetical protein